MITDKELLAICNLSNLKMEFADVVAKYKRIQDPNNPKKLITIVDRYHTISSLLDTELKGYEFRDELRKQYNFPELFTDVHFYTVDETSIKDSKLEIDVEDVEKENLKDTLNEITGEIYLK